MMPVTKKQSASILAVDLGASLTRVVLFDLVDGQFVFIGQASAPTTAGAPDRDVRPGVLAAASLLQQKTGFILIENGSLLMPAAKVGVGFDQLVCTHSFGPELRIALAGLTEEVSLRSLRDLAASIPSRVVASTSLYDGRDRVSWLDSFIRSQPDLIIMAGGTDNGAVRPLMRLAEKIMLLLKVMPTDRRPDVLYAGNKVLARRLLDGLSRYASVRAAPNLLQSSDDEGFLPALDALADVSTGIRSRQVGGLDFLSKISPVPLLPASHTFSTMVRFLARAVDPAQVVLGVNLDPQFLTLAASGKNKSSLQVSPYLFYRDPVAPAGDAALDQVLEWLGEDLSRESVRDYLEQKFLYPESVANTLREHAIEQALARAALRHASLCLQAERPTRGWSFDSLLAGGRSLQTASSPEEALLLLLDGIQPEGITTFILDQHDLLPSLGAAARVNSMLPVQVLASGAFQNLGTVISPVNLPKVGRTALRVRLETENTPDIKIEVSSGDLTRLPISMGQQAVLHIEWRAGTRLEPGAGRAVMRFKVTGGICGVLVDARGRPVRLPTDPSQRRQSLLAWNKSLTETLAQ